MLKNHNIRLWLPALLAICLLAFQSGYSQNLATWSTANAAGNEDSLSGTAATNATALSLKRSAGLSATPAANYFVGTGWSANLDTALYFQFEVDANSGYNLTANNLDFHTRRSNTGAKNFDVKTSADGFNASIFTGTIGTSDKANSFQFPTGFTGLNKLTVRIYGYGATGTSGTFRLANVQISGTVNLTSTQVTVTAPNSINLGNVYSGFAKLDSFSLAGNNWPVGTYIFTKAPVQIGEFANGPFSDTLWLNHGGTVTNKPIFISCNATTLGAFTDSIIFVADTLVKIIPVTGTVIAAPAGLISASSLSIDYGTVNTGSVNDSVLTVSGSFLTSNLVITAPAGVEISTSPAPNFASGSPITLTLAAGGVIAPTPIYIRYAPTTVGNLADSLTLASGGASIKIRLQGNAILSVAAVELAVWNTRTAIPSQTSTDSVAATSFDANVTAGLLRHGPGLVAQNIAGYLNSKGWTTGNSADTALYYEFSLGANSGYQLNLDSVVFELSRNGQGSKNYELRSNVDGYSAVLNTGTVATSAKKFGTALNSGFSGLTAPVNFRVYGYNSGNGTFRMGNVTVSGTVNVIGGAEKWVHSDFLMYPNPSEGWFKVFTGKQAGITIYNALGKPVYTSTVSDTETKTIATDNLAKGIYQVKINTSVGTTTQKLVIR